MIYIVEDDASIRELEQYALQTNQYTVRGFEDGASFWAAVRETVPDLVILDVMLPDEDGYQILGRLRETAATRTVPVIMVTAKTSEIDVVKGLDHGADDYLCKPFGIMEFISRVKAVLRRASTAPASTTTLRFGDITLDDVARTVTVDGEPVELTFKEYSLLHFFLEHPEEGIPTTCWKAAPLTCTCGPCAKSWATPGTPSAPCARWGTNCPPRARRPGKMPDTTETAHITAPRSMAHLLRTTLMAVGILSLLLSVVGAALLFQHAFAEQFDTDLSRTVKAIAVGYEHSADPQPEQLAQYADGLRLTLVAQDGTVLYDSATADPSTLPNHANRPEIQQAMAEGTGASVRRSATLGYDTHYYAVRLTDGSVLRLADETSNMWSSYNRVLPVLVAGCILIIILALVLAQVITKHLVQPITRMAEHLDCIEANVPYEELIPLAHTVQSDRKLREDNETIRREFTANVSHELKTPLTSISGYAELIENGMAKQEDIPTFGHRIHKEAQRMITLVSDILQLSELDGMSKQQENSPTADFVPVDLGVLVKDVATNMTVNARKAYITLQYKVQPVTVRGSHDLLTELVTNLCDNGIGIPQDSQSRVFERFYRVDKSRSKATGGTGLGLAIVKHIAVLHGARIDLESTVGTGTTIRIIFPKM